MEESAEAKKYIPSRELVCRITQPQNKTGDGDELRDRDLVAFQSQFVHTAHSSIAT